MDDDDSDQDTPAVSNERTIRHRASAPLTKPAVSEELLAHIKSQINQQISVPAPAARPSPVSAQPVKTSPIPVMSPSPSSGVPPAPSSGRRRRWDVAGQSSAAAIKTEPEPAVIKPEVTIAPVERKRRRFMESAEESTREDDRKNDAKPKPVIQIKMQPKQEVQPKVEAADLHQQEEELNRLRMTMKARATALAALERIAPELQRDADKAAREDELLEPNSDGTWEHAARNREMAKTAEMAQSQTAAGSGKHHMASFLPPEEQAKFMRQLVAAQKGEPIEASTSASRGEEYEQNKLTQDNKGFKLLQTMGWSGGGLGSEGQGITAPVTSGRAAGDTQGLGVASEADEAANADIYSVYRQRMMQAYKHRPNPLNNPRRQYY